MKKLTKALALATSVGVLAAASVAQAQFGMGDFFGGDDDDYGQSGQSGGMGMDFSSQDNKVPPWAYGQPGGGQQQQPPPQYYQQPPPQYYQQQPQGGGQMGGGQMGGGQGGGMQGGGGQGGGQQQGGQGGGGGMSMGGGGQ